MLSPLLGSHPESHDIGSHEPADRGACMEKLCGESQEPEVRRAAHTLGLRQAD